MNSQFATTHARTLFLASVLTTIPLFAQDESVPGNLTVQQNLDVGGNTASFGTSATSVPGYVISYDNSTPASIDFSAYASSANWRWFQNINGPQLKISSTNVLTLFNPTTNTEGVTLNPAGNSGIGISNPTGKLFIGPYWRTNEGGTSLFVSSSNHGPVSTDDLGITYSVSDPATVGPTKPGLVLYNDDTTPGGWSPMLLFSKAETGPSSTKATMAGIAARSPLGTGNSTNWIDGEMWFYTAGAATSGLVPRMIIDKEGNVGIGTTSPSAKLEVNGDLKVTGTITAPSLVLPDGALSSSRTTKLYNALGEEVATANADRTVNFATGVSVGSNPAALLTEEKAVYMDSLLSKFGYVAGQQPPTAVLDSIPITGNVTIKDVCQMGNMVYVVGSFTGTMGVGGSNYPYTVTWSSNGGWDGFVLVGSMYGSIFSPWGLYPVGGAGNDYLNSVTVDSNYQAIIGGETSGATTHIWGTPVTPQGKDGFIQKLYLDEGNFHPEAEATILSGAGDQVVHSVKRMPDGSVIVAGARVVSRIAADNTIQWSKTINATQMDIWSMALTPSGDIVIGGSFKGTTTGLEPYNITPQGTTNRAGMVAKLSGATGTALWAKAIGGSTSGDEIKAVAVDSTGSVFAAGSFTGTLGNLGASITAVNYDGLVVKLDGSSGNLLWKTPVGGAEHDTLTALALDATGDVGVVGNINGATTTLGSLNITSHGGSTDGITAKFSSMTGQAIEVGHIGGNSTETLEGMANLSGAWFVWGKNSGGQSTPIGGIRVYSGSYLVSFSTLAIETPLPQSSQALASVGSAANGAGAVALGSNAYANGSTSVALGAGFASGTHAFAAGSAAATQAGAVAIGYGASATSTGAVALGDSTANGYSSFAVGLDARAAHDHAVVLGYLAESLGTQSVSLGRSAKASSNSAALGYAAEAGGGASSAVGHQAKSTGPEAFAGGSYSFASGIRAMALGFNAHASGLWSTALGYAANSSGQRSLALGYSALSSAEGANALGNFSYADARFATGLGFDSRASGEYSSSLGAYTRTQAAYSTALGRYNVVSGDPVNWVLTDDLLVVGNGEVIGLNYDEYPTYIYSNALVVQKNGNTRVAGTVEAKGGFRTPPMGDIGMGSFTAGPTPTGHSDTEGSDPATLNAGLRYIGE